MAYVSLVTAIGQQKIAAALAPGGTPLQITTMAVGDGNGSPITPNEAMTALVHEVHSAAVSSIQVHPQNPNWIRAELVIPANTGGWTIREVGLRDAAGSLIAICQFPETYKPILADNVIGEGRVRITIPVSNSAAITLVVDPSAVYASQDFVNTAFISHAAAADPHTQYLKRTETAAQVIAPAATFDLKHGGVYIVDSAAAARSLRLPTPDPANGQPITVIRRGANPVDILRKLAGETIEGVVDDLRIDFDYRAAVLVPASNTAWHLINRRK